MLYLLSFVLASGTAIRTIVLSAIQKGGFCRKVSQSEERLGFTNNCFSLHFNLDAKEYEQTTVMKSNDTLMSQ